MRGGAYTRSGTIREASTPCGLASYGLLPFIPKRVEHGHHIGNLDAVALLEVLDPLVHLRVLVCAERYTGQVRRLLSNPVRPGVRGFDAVPGSTDDAGEGSYPTSVRLIAHGRGLLVDGAGCNAHELTNHGNGPVLR